MNLFALSAVGSLLAQPSFFCSYANLDSLRRAFAMSALLLSADSSTKFLVAAIFLLIGGIIVALIIYSVRAAKKRREALQKVATAMGFTFVSNGNDFRRELGKNLHLFQLGSSGKLYNVLRGSCSTGEIALFEYQYTQGSDENASTHTQTVAAFAFPNAALPTFHLGAEHWWHKVGKVFGYKPVAFDTHPEFGKRYFLRGPDEAAIRAFFRPAVLDYFQSLPEKPIWNVEASSPWLLLYLPSKLCKPDEIPAFRDATVTVASNIIAATR